MKILAARVNEMHGYMNPPHLELLVDTLDHEFVYATRTTAHGTAYLAETDGHVRFFHHSPDNENGYGGSIFHVTLEDGSTRDVRGPWSSNMDDMLVWFGVDTVWVSITADPKAFANGLFTAAHVTYEFAQTAAPFLPEWNIGHGYHGLTKKN